MVLGKKKKKYERISYGDDEEEVEEADEEEVEAEEEEEEAPREAPRKLPRMPKPSAEKAKGITTITKKEIADMIEGHLVRVLELFRYHKTLTGTA